ncbi:MAG: hypothetical protein HY974_01640 [Candidatus Kerfeldbacteria bacterium]|nr:hypothetical protein [Candidatus Kerfeldbacteria bacterium]
MSTLYSVGQMNQLADALEAVGYTPDHITKMRSKPDLLTQFKCVLTGLSEIVVVKHVIDCDTQPFVPEGLSVEQHAQGGQLEWKPDMVGLYLSEKQKNGGFIGGNKLRKELGSRHVLNANVLDYLLANPHLIPEEWKGKYIFFWGTIYRGSGGDLYVRYLYWGGDRWDWDYCYWLDGDWDDNNPAAVLASS